MTPSQLAEPPIANHSEPQLPAVAMDPVARPPVITTVSNARHQHMGVDLSQYPSITDRETFAPINATQDRGLAWPIAKSFAAKLMGKIPNPMMLTHILTTRCNYSCGFCSFADTLNAKTDELSLEEITKTYKTIGESLNTIVYSGGETTLHKHLPEIIEAAYTLTPVKSVYIISNAWKPERLFQITHQVMQRCPGLHLTWSLSIEGPKAINNAQRYTKANTWDAWQNTIDTMEGLKAMRERFGYSELNVQLCTVCSPDNAHVMDDWYAMVRDELQPDKWNLNLMRKSVQMSDSALPSFGERRQHKTFEPFEQTYLRITEQVRQDVLAGRLKFRYHTQIPLDGGMKSAVDLLSQEQNRATMMETPDLFPCQAGLVGAYIGSDGTVAGCEEFANNTRDPKHYGNLRDVNYDFQALWQSQAAQALRCKTGKATECHGCTLESQRNYPSILVSIPTLARAFTMAPKIS